MLFRVAVAIAAPFMLAACAASPKTFYANPTSVKDTTLCRTILEAAAAGNEQFARDTATEAVKRGLTLEQCQSRVNTENAILAGVAVAAVGVAAVGACSSGGCSGYSAPAYRSADYDCLGGGGDGPYFVKGPVRVGWDDPYDLDRDGDGIGCEPFGDLGA